jgi:Phosphotransferase enzyme family
MSSARSDAFLLSYLRELIRDNAESVFGVAGSRLRLEHVSLSRPRRRNRGHGRHHRLLTVRYAGADGTGEKRIWLKFLKSRSVVYDVHVAAWTATRGACELFPQPYFYGEWQGGAVMGMELIEGAALRALFLRRALVRRTGALDAVFAALGRALRAFHDSSEPSGVRSLDDLEENARRLAASTAHLATDERRRALERITAAAVTAGDGGTWLPLIRVHHDCTLRNVVVRRDGSPCLLDLDSMPAPGNSRWYDLTVFLINLESQIKYAPLCDAGSIAAAWGSFWSGYLDAGVPDGLPLERAQALLFLVKFEYVFEGTWLPVFDVYTDPLARRYLGRLKRSLLGGQHFAFGGAV